MECRKSQDWFNRYVSNTGNSWVRAKYVLIVYVEWASRVKFVTIFGDLYQIKLWVICNNLNQFAHLSSASGPSNDVIKMATIVLLMYIYKISYLKQYLRDDLLLEMIFRLYLTDWTSNNTKKMCSIFLDA